MNRNFPDHKKTRTVSYNPRIGSYSPRFGSYNPGSGVTAVRKFRFRNLSGSEIPVQKFKRFRNSGSENPRPTAASSDTARGLLQPFTDDVMTWAEASCNLSLTM